MRALEGAERPACGQYFASDRDLFCVERTFDDRALIEDCRTGVLLDIALTELARLRHVRPSRPAEVAERPGLNTRRKVWA